MPASLRILARSGVGFARDVHEAARPVGELELDLLRIELEGVRDERRGRFRVANLARVRVDRGRLAPDRELNARAVEDRSPPTGIDDRRRGAGPLPGARSCRPGLPEARPRAGTSPRRRRRRWRGRAGSACSRASFAEVEVGRLGVRGHEAEAVLATARRFVRMPPRAAISELSCALSARSCARSWPSSSRRTFSRRTATLSATTPASSSAIAPIQTTPARDAAARRRGRFRRTVRYARLPGRADASGRAEGSRTELWAARGRGGPA